jgi:hypothetical protein
MAWTVLVAALLIYAAGLLWPFTLRVPTWVANGATWTKAGTLRFEKPGLALSLASPEWQAISRDLGLFRVSLRARAFSPQQEGPARLFTLARDTYDQNVVIGQVGDDVIVRLPGLCRGARTDADVCPKQLRVRDAFATSEWVDVELLVEPGRAALRAGTGGALEVRLSDRPLRDWDASQRLALGNDVSGFRPWLGELQRVIVTTPLASEDWLRPDKLDLPSGFWLLDRQPKLVPFLHTQIDDLVLNLFLYVPLTVLLCVFFGCRDAYQLLRVVLIVFLTSSLFEVAQLFVETRNPSATDVILNTCGSFVMAALTCLCLRKAGRGNSL